jgi:hypothetical protein
MLTFWPEGEGRFVVVLSLFYLSSFLLLLLLNMHNFPFLVRTRMFYGSLSFSSFVLSMHLVKLLIACDKELIVSINKRHEAS